jgi:predicted nucleotidyltransferase
MKDPLIISSQNQKLGFFSFVFEDLAEVQAELGVRFCLIGATARDVWFRDHGHTLPLRATNDIDVTVAVPTHKAWEQVRDSLTQNKNYYPKAGNPIKLFKKILIGDQEYEAELVPSELSICPDKT